MSESFQIDLVVHLDRLSSTIQIIVLLASAYLVNDSQNATRWHFRFLK